MEGQPINILLVEDDPAHAEIVKRNLESNRVANLICHVSDGEMALDYLYKRKHFIDAKKYPRPDLILLDLRLPKIDGHEVLRQIKEDKTLCNIPVVVLTTSSAEIDVAKAYCNKANSYLVKPVDFNKFTEMLETFGYYWLVWNKFPR